MKLSSFSLFLIIASVQQSHASGIPTLRCIGGSGGPQPAQAVLSIEPFQNGKYFVQIELVNPYFPDGISGSFEANYDPTLNLLDGRGELGPIDSAFSIQPGLQNGTRLVIDDLTGNPGHKAQPIDYGFGVHFICN